MPEKGSSKDYVTKTDLDRVEEEVNKKFTNLEKELQALKMVISKVEAAVISKDIINPKSQEFSNLKPLMVPPAPVSNSLNESDVEIVPLEFYFKK